MKVTKASIIRGSTDRKDIFTDPNYGKGVVKVELEDGSEAEAFSYYMDELSFTPQQFVGKTLDEARCIHHDADVAYLRS